MDHFIYRQGVLHAEDIPLPELAEKIGTPFYCYSTATLVRHYKVFDEAFAAVPHRVCYATKASGNLAVIKTLARLGCGADVVSEGEVRKALAAGVPAGKIVFSGVGKTRSEMAYALKQDIFQFNIESEPELHALQEVAASLGKTARIAIRVNPDVDAETHAKISTGRKENKFGIDIDQAMRVYGIAADCPNIRVQGVSVHIGSQLLKLDPFSAAFRRVRELVVLLRGAGHAITHLDLGGGLGIPYREGEAPPDPQEYARVTIEATKGLDCELVFEPGRMIVGNAGILVTRVIYVKKGGARTFVIVDAAMNDLLRPSLYSAYHEIVPVRETSAAKTPCDIVGPVCESGDTFAEQRSIALPEAGDLLVFRSAGAYGAVMASTYNARPLVPEVMVNGREYAIIRKRPSYEEMLAQDSVPNWL